MADLLSAAQMQAIERAAIESGLVTGLELMERAGAGAVRAMLVRLSAETLSARRAIILCGQGNNGGDGFVIARLLADAGWTVEVYFWGDAGRLPPDARANHDRLEHPVRPFSAVGSAAGRPADLIVDALLGIGVNRPLPGDLVAGWAALAAMAAFRVAVDCVSGLDCDTGQLHAPDTASEAMSADLTVTFHSAKLGHYMGAGPAMSGEIEVVDIGLKDPDREGAEVRPTNGRVRLVGITAEGGNYDPDIWPLPLISKAHRAGGHKYQHGHAVVFAGDVGKGGAGRLAARAALRSGAGLVTVICPPSAIAENAMHLNAIMLEGLAAPADLAKVADNRVSAFCLGPGLGIGDRARALVQQVLTRRGSARSDPAVVLDADALTSFEAEPEALFAMVHERTVLTPHMGEFGRLFPDIAARADALTKVEMTCAAAARAGCIVLLKGELTVIAAPDGACAVHSAQFDRAAPWLATAGSGDVLAGLIAGLAAPGTEGDLFAVVEVAVWVHVECARSFGPGLIAEDLPEELPRVLTRLGA